MNRIKNIAFTLLLTLSAFGAMLYTSCNTDKCKDTNCNNGICIDGTCQCNAGYEGSDCLTLSTAKFAKSWTAPSDTNIVSGVILNPYNCVIAQGDSVNKLTIGTGFYDNFFTRAIRGYVSSSAGSSVANVITVPLQYPDGTANYSVSGTATYNSNGTLFWDYTITPPASSGGTAKRYHGLWN